MGKVMDDDGRVVDTELNELGREINAKFKALIDKRTDWTPVEVTIAAFHLQGYLGTEVMRRVMANIMKQAPQQGPPVRLAPNKEC